MSIHPQIYSFLFCTVLFCGSALSQIQSNTTLLNKNNLSEDSTFIVSKKFIHEIDGKAKKYYDRLNSRTERTLEKLAKWEEKLRIILEKASPETSRRLFGDNQLTFSSALEKYRQGISFADHYSSQYDAYRDQLTNTIKYLEKQEEKLDKEVAQPFKHLKNNLGRANKEVENTEAIQHFIKERKKELLQQAFKYIGQSKYLQRISKESYYYLETVRNYKTLFSEGKKAEEAAIKLLQKIPAFNQFLQENSMLASLFGTAKPNGLSGTVGLLQSRAQVQNLLATTLRSNPQQFQQGMLQAKSQLNQLKQRINQWGQGGGDMDIPNFHPNTQRSKTFFQRIELSGNFQSTKHNSYFPVSSDIGFSVGYKPSDKIIIGIGGSFSIGWGSDIKNIHITQQGLGLRSFVDWRLKKQFFLSGGYEQNYFSEVRSLSQLQDISSWKNSALIGISKKYKVGKKKKGEMKLLYDFFSQTKIPKTSPVLFRIGFCL